jgi:diguanylate cyclase (GGDEF)-like protein
MVDKPPVDPKATTNHPAEREEGTDAAAAPAPEGDKTIAEREVAVRVGEQVVLDREEVALAREEVVHSREEATDKREETADLREGIASVREQAMRSQEETSRDAASRSVRIEAQLRAANQDLVDAAAHARTMSDTVELTSAQMSYMAGHDFLTGLPNRSQLLLRLAESIVLARHHDKRVALLSLDLDHFKHINDSLGHEVGDRLLQAVAARLQTCIRRADTVSRQSGDEFVVVLAEVETVQNVADTAEKLIKTMAEPHVVDGHRLHVTLSVGISLFPDDGKDVETMLRNANIAMHHAKQDGRNSYHVFTAEMNVRALARQSIGEALHRALDQHEFVLLYQPKVNLDTGRISGAEALLRWQQSNRLICPMQFIGIAEECGLILPLGRWVLHDACRQAQAWAQAGLSLGTLAVNVSSIEFHSRGFLAGVRDILDDTGFDPHQLEIELTESGLMRDTEPAMALLHALKDIGIQIAIDDFGTGYSSLSYLRRFPIDTLKIDQSFVRDIDGEAGGAIVSAIVAMGASLKQRVVAEGIETAEQLAFLQSRQCAEGQGYFFSPPVAAEAFTAMLANGRC